MVKINISARRRRENFFEVLFDFQVFLIQFFFTGAFFVSRVHFSIFFTGVFFVSRVPFSFFFTGTIFFFTGGIWTKFSRAKSAFHAHFFVHFQNFSREPFFFHGQNREILDFFHGSLFIFHAQKKNTDQA